jgi:hypothetical protein
MTQTKMPKLVKVAELTGSELGQPSGIHNPDGTPVRNFDAIALIDAKLNGSDGIFLSTNGHLSPEAKARNTALSRDIQARKRAGDMVFAVISRRPPEDQ